MKKTIATFLLLLPVICSAQYIRLPVEEAFATAKSKQGKLILSDRQKNCADSNLFALLILDEAVNFAGCWFYDAQQSVVYVRFAGERQHKGYPAGAFKPMRESDEATFDTVFSGTVLTTEQKRQASNARPGRVVAD